MSMPAIISAVSVVNASACRDHASAPSSDGMSIQHIAGDVWRLDVTLDLKVTEKPDIAALIEHVMKFQQKAIES